MPRILEPKDILAVFRREEQAAFNPIRKAGGEVRRTGSQIRDLIFDQTSWGEGRFHLENGSTKRFFTNLSFEAAMEILYPHSEHVGPGSRGLYHDSSGPQKFQETLEIRLYRDWDDNECDQPYDELLLSCLPASENPWKDLAEAGDREIDTLQIDLEGNLHDPLGAIPKLEKEGILSPTCSLAGRVPEKPRILMQYFADCGWFPEARPDPAFLPEAGKLARHLDSHPNLFFTWLLRLLERENPVNALRGLLEAGILEKFFKNPDPERIRTLLEYESLCGITPHNDRRYAVLQENPPLPRGKHGAPNATSLVLQDTGRSLKQRLYLYGLHLTQDALLAQAAYDRAEPEAVKQQIQEARNQSQNMPAAPQESLWENIGLKRKQRELAHKIAMEIWVLGDLELLPEELPVVAILEKVSRQSETPEQIARHIVAGGTEYPED